MAPSSNFLFEHFDPDFELGTLDEQGRTIRPRKKPGRKPNPPTPAQRKAQNRAAQRAFRERKRQAMREAEATIKRYAYMRDQAYREIRRLKRRLEELEFESNYLKGYTLALKMACIADRVELPQFWEMKKKRRSNTNSCHKKNQEEQQEQHCLNNTTTSNIPRIFDFFLDKEMNIISIDHHMEQQEQCLDIDTSKIRQNGVMVDDGLSPSSILSTCSSAASDLSSCPYYVSKENDVVLEESSSSSSVNYDSLVDLLQPLPDFNDSLNIADTVNKAASLSPRQTYQPDACQASHCDNIDQLLKSISSIAPHLANHLDSPFLQEMTKTDLIPQTVPEPSSPIQAHHELLAVTDTDTSTKGIEESLLSFFNGSNSSTLSSLAFLNQPQQFLHVTNALQFSNIDSVDIHTSPTPATADLDVIMIDSPPVMDLSEDIGSPISAAAAATTDDEDETIIDRRTGVERAVTTEVDEEDKELSDLSYYKKSSNQSSVSDTDATYANTTEMVDDASTSLPNETTTNKKTIFPPMTALEAIEQLRIIKQLNASTRALFTPTELQKRIRHDTRIDVVPGASIRDHMILFQDFYNANELFDYLATHACFLGGEDLGNVDAWFVPPTFFKRYWFLCPNQKVDRLDNAVEIMVRLGKKVVQWMEAIETDKDRETDVIAEEGSGTDNRTSAAKSRDSEETHSLNDVVREGATSESYEEKAEQSAGASLGTTTGILSQAEKSLLQTEDYQHLEELFQSPVLEEFSIEQFLMDEDTVLPPESSSNVVDTECLRLPSSSSSTIAV